MSVAAGDHGATVPDLIAATVPNLVYDAYIRQHLDAKIKDAYGERLRAVEDVIARLIQDRPLDSIFAESSSKDQSQAYAEASGNTQRPLHGKPESCIATLTEATPGSLTSAVDGMGTLADPEEKSPKFFGPSSNIAFLRQTLTAATNVLDSLKSVPRCTHDLNYTARVSQSSSPLSNEAVVEKSSNRRVNLFYLPSHSLAISLINRFFADTARLFPFIDQAHVLRAYTTAKKQHFARMNRSLLALINAILAIATYVSANPMLPDRSVETNAAESKVFLERAEGLLEGLNPKSACIETVQAQLLLVQYCQGLQNLHRTLHLNGLAVHTALQLGLHSNAGWETSTSWESEIRRRTWFACFILDGSLSMTVGSYPSVPLELLPLELPSNRSFDTLNDAEVSIDPANLNSGLSHDLYLFNSTIELFKIQGDIIKRMYNSNIHPIFSQPLPKIMEHIIALEQDLDAWRQTLIPQLRQRPWDDRVVLSSSTPPQDQIFGRFSAIMTLRFLNARILLHRPVLIDLVKRFPAPTQSPVSYDSTAFFVTLGLQSVEVSQDCGTEIIEIVSRMKPLPVPWWIAAYYAFNASLILFNCALVRWDSVRILRQDVSKRASDAQLDSLPKVLLAAVETLERIGSGTKRLERLTKIILDLNQIIEAMKKAQRHAQLPFVPSDCNGMSGDPLTQTGHENSRQDESVTCLDTMRVDFHNASGPLLASDFSVWGAEFLSIPEDDDLTLLHGVGGL